MAEKRKNMTGRAKPVGKAEITLEQNGPGTLAGKQRRPGKKADRAAGHREKILAAAQKVFLQRGFSGTSTREIARAAGVSLGNLYNHFRTKEEIFEALIEENAPAAEIEELVTYIERPDFPANFAEVLEKLQRIVAENTAFIRLTDIDGVEFGGKKTQKIIFQSIGRVWLPMEAMYKKHLRQGLVRKFNPRIGLPIMALTLMAVFVVRERFNVAGLLDEKVLDNERLIKELADMFLLGLLPREDS